MHTSPALWSPFRNDKQSLSAKLLILRRAPQGVNPKQSCGLFFKKGDWSCKQARPAIEGVTIQKSSLRSLKGGTTLDRIFAAVDEIRKQTDKPLILMMYLNTIFVYGTEKFFSLCKEKGVDGVTGVRSEFKTDFDEFFGLIKENAKCPCCVGFGISSPEQAKKMSAYCDGVIVGSAIVRIMEAKEVNSPKAVGEFVKSLKDAME